MPSVSGQHTQPRTELKMDMFGFWPNGFGSYYCGERGKSKGSIEKRLVFEYFLLCFGLLVGLGWDEKEGEFLFFFSHGSGLFCVIVCLVLGCLDSSLGRKIQRKLNSYGFGPEFKVSFGFGYRNVCVCVGTRNASVRYIQLRLEQRIRIWVGWFSLWLVCITFEVGK